MYHHCQLGSTEVEIFERLARLSPTMDDKYIRPEAVEKHLGTFDAVRDKALWKQLEKLLDPLIQEAWHDAKRIRVVKVDGSIGGLVDWSLPWHNC